MFRIRYRKRVVLVTKITGILPFIEISCERKSIAYVCFLTMKKRDNDHCEKLPSMQIHAIHYQAITKINDKSFIKSKRQLFKIKVYAFNIFNAFTETEILLIKLIASFPMLICFSTNKISYSSMSYCNWWYIVFSIKGYFRDHS